MIPDRLLDDHAILADARVHHLVLAVMQKGYLSISSGKADTQVEGAVISEFPISETRFSFA